MITSVAVPSVVVEWARSHYRRTRSPYLFEARTGDWQLDVLQGSHGRYLLMLDIGCGQALGLLEGAEGTPSDRAAHVLVVLADAAVCALGGGPITFKSEGIRVGRVGIVKAPRGHHAVRVRGHVALSCLSWLLYAGRAGYHLALPPDRVKVELRLADNYTEAVSKEGEDG